MKIVQVYRWLVWQWARWVNPVRELPPKGRWWFENRAGDIHSRVWVLFTEATDHNRYTRYHVTLMLSHAGRYWMVDAANQLLIAPVSDPERFISRLHPDYVAQGEIPARDENMGWMLYEPYSCVTLTRSMLGIFDSSIQTSEQLLVELWRRRYVRGT